MKREVVIVAAAASWSGSCTGEPRIWTAVLDVHGEVTEDRAVACAMAAVGDAARPWCCGVDVVRAT